MLIRLRQALRDALTGALTLWIVLFVHVLWVFGLQAGYLDGGRFPLTPSVRVTVGALAFETALAVALFVPLGLLIGLWLGRKPDRLRLPVLAVIWGLMWLVAAGSLAGLFAADFGTTWGFGEPFMELFRHPWLTPLTFAAGMIAFVVLVQRRG